MSEFKKLSYPEYEALAKPLLKELARMARWLSETGQRIVVVFEGRDTAGKGGSIDAIARVLNPRQCRVAALPSPSDRERGQWYFQRYIPYLPAKGEMTLAGVKLDLKKIKLPVFEVATKEDHIAPASSVFIGSKLFGGPVRFVMAGSGHIAGVVNPPAKKKYRFWAGTPADSLAEWMKKATETPGSWWPDWSAWLGELSGPKIPARDAAAGPLKPIEDAPGSYVKARL